MIGFVSMHGVFRMMEHWGKIWWPLKGRRRKAEKYPLRILILGHDSGGIVEYKTLCKLRDELCASGHGAAFWWELCSQDNGRGDVVQEVILQAFEAHLIVAVYCFNQRQSKGKMLIENILSNKILAAKTIVYVEESLERASIAPFWEQISQITQVHRYNKSNLRDEMIGKVLAETQKLRRQVYVRDMLRGEIF
jgi:hypothetical protein